MKTLFGNMRRITFSVGAPLTLLLVLADCGDSSGDEAPPRTPGQDNESTAAPASTADAGATDEPADDAGSSAASARDAQAEPARADASTRPQPQTDAAPPTPTEYEAAKALIGSYAVMIKYRDVITVGIAGTSSMVTTVLAVAEIKDDAAAKVVRLAVNLCSSHIGAPTKHLNDLEVFLAPTALTTAQLDPAVLRVTQADGKTSWKTDEVHGVVGWKWSSPSDQIPTRDDDPRLSDQDADGQPGVTARFTGHSEGSIYLALLYRFLFSGTVAANGDLTGTTTSSSKESMLGTTEILLLGMSIDRAPDAETADNTVRLTRQPSALSCDQLIAQKDALFR